MGGSINIVSTALELLSDVAPSQQSSTASKETGQLRAERAAQEAELERKEADERKLRRDNLTTARQRELRRQQADDEESASGQTTLLNGGAGLEDDPEVAAPKLKDKFGE